MLTRHVIAGFAISLCTPVLAPACGGSTPAPSTAPESKAPRSNEKRVSASVAPADTESHPAWDALVERGEVWARPELDRFCSDGGRAYYVHTSPTTTYDEKPAPELAGCQPRFEATVAEVGHGQADPPCGAQGVAGRTYCCPAELSSPPPVVSGGGPSCLTVLNDFLIEQGADPLVTRPRPGERSSPTFDRSAKVLGRGAYLDACDVGSGTEIEICAAVRQGRAEGVSVCLEPADAEAGDCIARAVRHLEFPTQERLDLTETTFEPLR